MTSVELLCRHCDGVNEFEHWPDEGYACKFCGTRNDWRDRRVPEVDYDVGFNDRRFLKSLRIAPE